MTVVKNIFYNPNKMLSYNSFLSFIVGARGVGKSYALAKYCIQRFIKTGEQFVYVRRFNSELDTAFPKFFDNFKTNGEFKEHTFVCKKIDKLNTFIIDNKVAGFAVAITTATILKSTSFPLVKNIIFDEFIIEKGNYHYLKNEPSKFLDLIETIARLRDVRVFLLSNAVTITNPYFEYFHLQLGYKSEFKVCKRDKNGEPLILVQYITNEAYADEKANTRFGQLTQNTTYGDYAIKNKWYLDDTKFVEKRTGNTYCVSTFVVNGISYGLWFDRKSGLRYLSMAYDPTNPCRFAIDDKSHNLDTVLESARKNTWFMMAVKLYKIGLLRFESIEIKNKFAHLIEQVIGC